MDMSTQIAVMFVFAAYTGHLLLQMVQSPSMILIGGRGDVCNF